MAVPHPGLWEKSAASNGSNGSTPSGDFSEIEATIHRLCDARSDDDGNWAALLSDLREYRRLTGKESAMIRCVQLWTGDDGDSHFEEGTIDLSRGERGDVLSEVVAAASLSLRLSGGPQFRDEPRSACICPPRGAPRKARGVQAGWSSYR
jgi:hypothetical protein